MHWDVSVSFFVSVVFGNVVKIITSDHNGSLHLCADDNTLEDLSSNMNVASKWAFLVNIFRFNCFFRSLESQTNILEVSDPGARFLSEEFFAVEEHIFLLLECSFVLSLKIYVLGYQPSITTYLY